MKKEEWKDLIFMKISGETIVIACDIQNHYIQ